MNQSIKCPITGIDGEYFLTRSYRLKIDNEYRYIRLGSNYEHLIKDEIFTKNKHILAGAIITNQLFDYKDENINYFAFSADSFDKLNRVEYPKTPKAKLDNLLLSLCKMQEFEGQVIKIQNLLEPEFYYRYFFKSHDECLFYLDELQHQRLIEHSMNLDGTTHFNITFEGLKYYLKLTEEGSLSKRCFVAMSFNPTTMKVVREAIRMAIEKNGFEPIIIDEQLIESSQTINDAIIAEIKSSKFCIADFSEQKDGVYFESGLAIGLGRPVIFTCHKEWFDKSHFDTNHFPHIVYETEEELAVSLNTKIKAWIK